MTRAGFVLSRCLAGERFHSAAGLPTYFPWRLKIAARDRALKELSTLRADLNPTQLARWIRREAAVISSIRRDGALGHVDELVNSECDRSERHLRRLISELRGRGQQQGCNGHGEAPASASTRR